MNGPSTAGVPDQTPDGLWADLGRKGSRAAVQLAIRSVVLRGLTFVGTIALARLLAPSDFGVYGMVVFVVALWNALGDFGLGAALVQQHDAPTSTQLRSVWTMQQLIAAGAVATIWLLAPAIAGLISGLPTDAEWMLRLLSVGLLLSSLRTLPAVMMEREIRFGPLAAAEVAQMVAFYAIAISLAAAGAGAWAFVVAGVAQLGVGALIVNLAWRRLPGIGLDRASLSSLFGFGFAYQAAVVINTIRDAPLPVMVGIASGAAAAGLLQFAVRVALTIASIDEIVARIAFPAFARLQGRAREQARAVDTAILMTALIVIPAQCLLVALAPVLVTNVFGDKWSDAVLPLQLLCLGTLLRFPARYLRQAEFAEGDSRRGVAMSIATTILALGCFGIGLAGWGLVGAAAGFLVGASAGLAATIFLARQALQLSWQPYGRLVGCGVAAAVVATAVLRMCGVGPGAWDLPIDRDLPGMALATAAATLAFWAVWIAGLLAAARPTLMLGCRLAKRAFR